MSLVRITVQSTVSLAALSIVALSGNDAAHAQAVSVTNGTVVAVPGPSFPLSTYVTSAADLAGVGFFAQGAGSTINGTGVSITTNGALAQGIRVGAGGLVTMSAGSITTNDLTGTSAGSPDGVLISGTATTARAELRGTSITTAGPFAAGLRANGNATALVDAVTINTAGASAFGIRAQSGGQITVQNGTQVTTQGATAQGFTARGTGSSTARIIITDSGTVTHGADSTGFSASSASINAKGIIIGTNATAETFGANAYGAAAGFFGSSVTLTGGSVTTHGTGARGLSAENDATVSVTGTTVITTGQNAHGAFSTASSVPTFINLTNASVQTSGTGSRGLSASTRGVITATGTSVTTTGSAAPGLFTDNAAIIDYSNGTITTTAANSAGIAFGPNAVGTLNTVTLTNATVNAGGDAVLAAAGRNNLTLNASTLNAESGLALNVTSSSGTTVTANASTINGAAFTNAGSVSNVTLQNSTTWNMTGTSNVTNLVNDNSLIDFSPPTGDPTLPASYKTLTTNTYIGTDGRIALNAYLGNDSSPSDRLVINGGTATGTTGLLIKNTTGPGDLTTGNGILVVEAIAGGTTAVGAFMLGAPAVAGPYEYTLFRSSVDASGPENWYLRSTLNCALDPTSPLCPQPPDPEPPNYRQEVSLYTAMPVLAALYGRGLIDTLHERMGGDAQLLPSGDSTRPDRAWGRLFGQRGERDGDKVGIYGSDGPAFDYQFGAIQAGLDLYRNAHEDGQRDDAGIYLALGKADADVEHNLLGTDTFHAGDDTFTAYSIGGYWTRFGASDWYLDGVVQATWYDMEMTANRGVDDGETDGFGFAASLEGGYPIDLGGDWQLEPQAQLVYQAIDISDFDDGAADVSYSDEDSLAGRLGARLVRQWIGGGDHPRHMTFWGRADVWHEFLGDPTTEISSATGPVSFTADLGSSWGKLGVGAAMQGSETVTLYGNANYEASFDGDTEAWEGKFGLKANW